MIIVHVITGLGDGGAESALFRLCVNDDSNNHFVISLCCGGKYGSLLTDHGIQVHALNMPRGRVTISGLFTLWRLIRNISPDAVQTWMYHANLLGGIFSRLAGVSNINWGIHHADLGGKGTSRSTVAIAKLCAWISPYIPKRIICCGEKSAQVHAAFGYDKSRIEVVFNGYDLTLFNSNMDSRLRLRNELGLLESQRVIGFVARLDPLKDHENLFKAICILKNQGRTPHCLLIGSGMETSNKFIVDLINKYGLATQVNLLGRRDDIPAVMNALDLHVMSSCSEAFPNVLAESMACGSPCVSTKVGDAEEILGGTGWVVPPQDPPSLAKAINDALSCLEDRNAWIARQESARKHIVDSYSLERMIKSYTAIWKE